MKKDSSLYFDGVAGDGYSRKANRFAKNQWSGHSNDGRLVQFERGPTKGNDGSCGHSGMPHVGAKPPVGAMPGIQTGKDMFTGRSQVRNPGGTKEMPKCGKDSFNMGRGPTKGTQQ